MSSQDGFYVQCVETEESTAVALAGATPAMMYHLVVVNDEADSQEAFFGGGGLAPSPPNDFNPVVLPPIGPSPPPPSSGSSVAGQVQEFRRVCSVANLTICAPPVRVLLAARCVAQARAQTHTHAQFCWCCCCCTLRLLPSCHAELRVLNRAV